MEASRQALEDADGAQQCASAEYARAEELLRQAEQAIEDKEYDRAEQLANQAKAQAERAMEVAQRNPYYPECDLADEILRKIDRVESMSSLRKCAPERYQNAVDLADDAKEALDAKEFDRAAELADNAIQALEDAESYARQQDGYPECDDEDEEAMRSYDWQRVQFAFDSSHLDRAARQILDSHADYLKDSADVDITIEGHASMEGTSEYNMALGQRRANAAKRYIQNLGVDSNRMRTVSYGEERPLERGAGAINRRAEFKTR
jgi:peptidoglycan-associated lipoprotein